MKACDDGHGGDGEPGHDTWQSPAGVAVADDEPTDADTAHLDLLDAGA